MLLAHYAVLTAVALVFLFPVVFMVVSSLKPNLQLLRDSGSLLVYFRLQRSFIESVAATGVKE